MAAAPYQTTTWRQGIINDTKRRLGVWMSHTLTPDSRLGCGLQGAVSMPCQTCLASDQITLYGQPDESN
jgi:hypothetical protein